MGGCPKGIAYRNSYLAGLLWKWSEVIYTLCISEHLACGGFFFQKYALWPLCSRLEVKEEDFSNLILNLLHSGYLRISWSVFRRKCLAPQLVKSPPALQETWVWSLGWEIPWRRERLPTPVFWPGEFHGLCSPWGLKESDMTEQLSLSILILIFGSILPPISNLSRLLRGSSVCYLLPWPVGAFLMNFQCPCGRAQCSSAAGRLQPGAAFTTLLFSMLMHLAEKWRQGCRGLFHFEPASVNKLLKRKWSTFPSLGLLDTV